MIAHASALARNPAAFVPQRHLRCAEVWGGICDRDELVACPGLTVSVYSESAGGDHCGGDIHYLSVCDHGLMTRAVVADVVGHGHAATGLSRWLYEAISESMNRLDSTAVLSGVNRLAAQFDGAAMTTATIVTYYRVDHSLRIANAGHPPPLISRRRGPWEAISLRSTCVLSNLPLGVEAQTRYDQRCLELQPGDRLMVYTDGLIESTSPGRGGAQLGVAGLRRILDGCNRHPDGRLDEYKQAILASLRAHLGGRRHMDDVSFVLLEADGARSAAA